MGSDGEFENYTTNLISLLTFLTCSLHDNWAEEIMEKHILFEGKVLLAGESVDFRIYKNVDEDCVYYSYDVNPEVKDETQADFHNGEIKRAKDLETLLFRFSMFQHEFTKIDNRRINVDF